MGLLDDLRKELVKAMEENARQQGIGAPPPAPEQAAAAVRTSSGGGGTGDLPLPPAKRLAVVTCMDTRVLVEKALNLRAGDAHVLRNAGGLATSDVLRSLAVSIHLLEVNQIILMGHTGCGMMTFQDDELRARIREKMGTSVPVPEIGAFDDVEVSVREQIRRVRTCPWIPDTVPVRGFVYDIKTGRLTEVAPESGDARQVAPPQKRTAPAAARGRLQRERMERGAPVSSPLPSRDDFRRKVTAMAAGEPEPLGTLLNTPVFDLGLPDTAATGLDIPTEPDKSPAGLTISPREMLRGLVLGEVLDEPKGRRVPRPHPK